MLNPRTTDASLEVPLSDVHPWLELADLDAGGDIGRPQRGIAPHNVDQTPADLPSQSLRSARREEDRCVHEAAAIGTDVKCLSTYGAALYALRLETLRIPERVVESVEEMREAGGVAQIARILQDDVRHYCVSVRSLMRASFAANLRIEVVMCEFSKRSAVSWSAWLVRR